MSKPYSPEVAELYTRLDDNLIDCVSPFEGQTQQTVASQLQHFDVVAPLIDVTDAASMLQRYQDKPYSRTDTLQLQVTPSGELWGTQKYDRHRPRSDFHVPIGRVVSLEMSDPLRVDWIPMAKHARPHMVAGQMASEGSNAYWKCSPRVAGVIDTRLSQLPSEYYYDGRPGAVYYDNQMERHFLTGLEIKNKSYTDQAVKAELMSFQAVQYAKVETELFDDPESVAKKELLAGVLKVGRGVSSDEETLRRHMSYAESIGIDTIPYVMYLGSLASRASVFCDAGANREDPAFIEQAIELARTLHEQKFSRSVNPSQGMYHLYNKIVASAHSFDTELAKHATRSIGSPAIKARLLTKMAIETDDATLLDDAFKTVFQTWTPDQQPIYLLRMYRTAEEYGLDQADRILERMPVAQQLRLREERALTADVQP